jgi:hypothetical protein
MREADVAEGGSRSVAARGVSAWVVALALASTAVLTFLVTGYLCWVVNTSSQAADRLNEFRATKQNLEKDSLTREQREIQKWRLYYIAARMPTGSIPEKERNFDFGPVDRSETGNVRLHLFGHLQDRELQEAFQRHNPTRGQLKNAP